MLLLPFRLLPASRRFSLAIAAIITPSPAFAAPFRRCRRRPFAFRFAARFRCHAAIDAITPLPRQRFSSPPDYAAG